MPLDSKLLESLLYEGEGVALDFKSAQYPFDNANVGEKAELLKDILLSRTPGVERLRTY